MSARRQPDKSEGRVSDPTAPVRDQRRRKRVKDRVFYVHGLELSQDHIKLLRETGDLHNGDGDIRPELAPAILRALRRHFDQVRSVKALTTALDATRLAIGRIANPTRGGESGE